MTKLNDSQLKGKNVYALELWHLIVIVLINLILIAGSYFTMRSDLYNHIGNPDVHMTLARNWRSLFNLGGEDESEDCCLYYRDYVGKGRVLPFTLTFEGKIEFQTLYPSANEWAERHNVDLFRLLKSGILE